MSYIPRPRRNQWIQVREAKVVIGSNLVQGKPGAVLLMVESCVKGAWRTDWSILQENKKGNG